MYGKTWKPIKSRDPSAGVVTGKYGAIILYGHKAIRRIENKLPELRHHRHPHDDDQSYHAEDSEPAAKHGGDYTLLAQKSEKIGLALDPPAAALPFDPLINYSVAYHWCLKGAKPWLRVIWTS